MEKSKGLILPVAVGIIVGMLLMPFGLGYMSNSKASSMAKKASQDATVAALTPLCIANAKADPEKLAEVMAVNSYKRREAVEKSGWPIYPNDVTYSVKRAISQGCLDGLI